MTDLPSHPHDAVINLNRTELEVLESVRNIVAEAEDAGSPQIAFHFGKALRRSRQVEGYAFAMLLYEMRQRWGTSIGFESDDDFVDVAAAEFGYGVETINKYLKVWEWCIARPGHPEERKHRLLGHQLDTLYRLAAASKEGQMDEGTWEEVAQAPNQEAIMEIRERLRGGKTSSESALRIMLERDGTLRGRFGNGRYVVGGVLNVNLQEEPGYDGKVISAMIERICRRAGIFGR